MINFFKSRLLLKTPSSMGEALAQLVDRYRIKGVGKKDLLDLQLYELLEKQLGYELPRAIACMVRLSFSEQCHIPAKRLIHICGLDEQVLRRERVLPQRPLDAGSAFRIVIADPWRVAFSEFAARGINVSVASASQIESAWAAYFRVKADEARQQSEAAHNFLLERLVKDCEALGADEFSVKSASSTRYEVQANKKTYSGKLPAGLSSRLVVAADNETALNINGHTLTAQWRDPSQNKHLVVSWRKGRVAIDERRVSASQKSVLEHSDGPYEQSNKTVLLVEDDDRFGLILCKLFSSKGYRVVRKANGIDALSWINSAIEEPLLVVCDIHMPGLDGIELTTKLRQLNCAMPILMLTSDDSDRVDIDAAAGGADLVVRKCSSPEILLAWSENLIQRFQRKPDVLEHVH